MFRTTVLAGSLLLAACAAGSAGEIHYSLDGGQLASRAGQRAGRNRDLTSLAALTFEGSMLPSAAVFNAGSALGASDAIRAVWADTSGLHPAAAAQVRGNHPSPITVAAANAAWSSSPVRELAGVFNLAMGRHTGGTRATDNGNGLSSALSEPVLIIPLALQSPEPGSLVLFGVGLALVCVMRRAHSSAR